MFTFNYNITLLQEIVGIVITTAMGMSWYSEKIGFGKAWMKLIGISAEEMKTPEMKKKTNTSMIISLFITAISVYALAVFVNNLTPTAACPLALAIFLWLISPFSITASQVLWVNKSWKLFFINGGFEFVNLLVLCYVLYYLKPV